MLVALTKAATGIILYDSGDCAVYAPVVGQICAAIFESDSECLVDCLEALTDLAAESGRQLFKRSTMGQLVPALLHLMNEGDEVEIVTSSCELLVTLCEEMPGYFRKTNTAATVNAVQVLVSMMARSLVDDGEAWSRANAEDDLEEEELDLLAQQALDRLSMALGERAFLGPAFAIISGFLRGSDRASWHQAYAGLMSIACIAEGCAAEMEDQLVGVLGMVWPAFAHPHPRVQWAACHALGQLCSDFGGTIQDLFSREALNHLVGLLSSSGEARVQAHAAAALVNFAEGVDAGLIDPFLDELFSRLVSLLAGGSSVLYLQEQLIATIASFAGAAGPRFIRYYGQIVPMLLDALRMPSSSQIRMLQCRALEAATLIVVAVGKDEALAAGPQLAQLLELMILIEKAQQQTEQEKDFDSAADPMLEYLQLAWVRMAQVLGSDLASANNGELLQLLIFPRFLKDAQAEADVTLLDADASTDAYNPEEWDFCTIRGRQLGIHTATLTAKAAAIENLAIIIEAVGAAFGPCAATTYAAIMPLLRFNLSEDVAIASAELIGNLVNAIHPAGWPEEATKELLATALLKFGPEPAYTAAAMDALARIVPWVPGSFLLSELERHIGGADGLIILLGKSISEAERRLQQKQRSPAADDEGDEDGNSEDEFLEDESSILYALARLVTAVFKIHGKAALAPLTSLWQFCLKLSEKIQYGDLCHASLCILDDLVQFGGEEAFASFPTASPSSHPILEALHRGLANQEDLDIRQAAIFGVGKCAEAAPRHTRSFVMAMLPGLLDLLDDPMARMPSHHLVTDNVVSALARIITAYPEIITDGTNKKVANILGHWAASLPVLHDEDEIVPVVAFLLTQLAQPERAELILAPPSAKTTAEEHLTNLFKAIVDTLVDGDSEEVLVKAGLRDSLLQACNIVVQPRLRADLIGPILANLTHAQLEKLQK